MEKYGWISNAPFFASLSVSFFFSECVICGEWLDVRACCCCAGLVKSLRRKEGRRIYSAIDQYFMFFEPPVRPPFPPSGAGPFSMLSYVMCIPPGRKFRGREKKGGWREGGKLFETGKWRLLPTLTTLTGHFPYWTSKGIIFLRVGN